MNSINLNIVHFIEKQNSATICCTGNAGNPYCFSCYYAINLKDGLLYFKSSVEAYHSILLKENPVIAGTILPDSLNKLKIKGVQLTGELLNNQDALVKDAYILYHRKHPIALAIKGEVFTIRLDSIKMTDSARIFGKKIFWNRTVIVAANTSN
ncbi:MAG: hypothetical protein IPH34_09750 [Chitinophagaceae bacterium]|nr:hypothetical protein [Chitinophagaceae bacterium]MBK8310055.1 hypothetical protein [Chitinophagaceae bacterium]MBK8607133.1 hypothetical protein [Chitinophagaceae bacterium]MBP6476513.1 hypothetical protein [Chitinophagaceae bacterium]MBP7107416.1 hypothetical protein [Chitinophagaceae bacterium]